MARFQVGYSEESDAYIGRLGYVTNGQTFGSQRVAVALAEQYIREGRPGVNVTDTQECLVKVWPYCRAITAGHNLPGGGRFWPDRWCIRQDLLSDGHCPEHTQGGVKLPKEPEQLMFGGAL